MNVPLLNPASPQAQEIWDLSIFVFFICLVILAIVVGLVIAIAIRFRAKSPKQIPVQTFGNTKHEIIWIVVPALVVVLLFVLTVRTMMNVDPPSGDRQADLVITGHQWWWEAQYPDSDVVTANEIHIPVGKRMLVRLESADVIHSFWVPALNSKMDAVPGHPNYIYLEANEPGLYRGQCTEFCGAQHAKMLIRVVAQPEEEFQAWIKAQQRLAAAPSSGLARKGYSLYKEKTCLNCHATGIGPDLNHVASRETLASGIIPNTPENLKKWLLDPAQFKPGAHMPIFQLTEEEADALVAYLETLK